MSTAFGFWFSATIVGDFIRNPSVQPPIRTNDEFYMNSLTVTDQDIIIRGFLMSYNKVIKLWKKQGPITKGRVSIVAQTFGNSVFFHLFSDWLRYRCPWKPVCHHGIWLDHMYSHDAYDQHNRLWLSHSMCDWLAVSLVCYYEKNHPMR
jgi:hypothetical protein